MSKITAYGSASAKADLIIPVVDPDDTTMAPSGTTKKITVGDLLATVIPNPMTALGDMITGGSSGAPGRLAGNTTTVRQFLVSQGTGSVAQLPFLSVIQPGDLPGPSDWLNVITQYGATGNTKSVSDAAMTASSAALTSATANFTSADAGKVIMVAGAGVIPSPATPTPASATSGGTIAAATYQVKVTLVNANGETVASSAGSVTTTGSTSTIKIASPAAWQNATSWYAYVTQAGGSTFFRQQSSGSPTALGTALTLTAAPTNTGANPPGSSSATGGVLSTTISSVTNSTTVTLAANASATVSAAKATYGTDDTTAINNAITAAGATAGTVYLPAGNYMVTGRLNINGQCRIIGSGSVMNDTSSGVQGTTLTASNSGACFFFSHTAVNVSGTELGWMAISYSGTGNAIDDINLQAGWFHDLDITVTNGGSAGLFASSSETANLSVIQVTFERVTVTSTAPIRTAPMSTFSAGNSGGISDVTFFRCKWNNNGQDSLQPAVLVACTAASGYHYATTFRDCYFEKPLGGAIRSLSGTGLLVDHCMFWDMHGLTVGASTVYAGAGAGNATGSQGVRITGCGRNRSSVNGSATWDIECEASTSQVTVDGYTVFGDSVTTTTDAYFNFHGCTDAIVAANTTPQGSSVNGNSTTVITNPAVAMVQIQDGQVTASQGVSTLQPSGDGTGAADTTAINASLSGNPVTVLAAGAWHITNCGFTVNARTLLGSGPGTVVNVVASSPGFVFSGPGQVEMGCMAIAIGAGSYGLTVNGLYDAHIHDLWLSGSTAAGGIVVNGDDALEQHYTDIVMRAVGGIGFDYERTTSIYTGSLYLDRVRMVTPPTGAQGFKFNSTAGSPSLNTVFMTQCVADAFYADAYEANDVAQVFVTDCWFAIIAGAAAGTVAMRITGGALQHSYDGCYTYNGLASGTDVLLSGALSGVHIGGGHVFDGASGNTALSLSGATTAAGGFVLGGYLNYCGTLTDSPVALSFGGQAASPPVFYTDGSGGASQNIAVIDAANPTGNTKYIRNGGGALQILNNAFNKVLLALADNGALTLAGNVTVQADDAVLNVISTLASQFNGPAVGLYNAISSLGSQAGVQLQVGINDAGITQGYATLVQVDHNGAFVQNLITIDLNAQTIKALLPLIAQDGLSMANNKITGLANGTVSTDAAAYGQTPAGGAVVSGQFLRAPVAYGPGSRTTLTATTTTMAALSSANVNTGSFTAPPSGTVLVSVSSVVAQTSGTARFAFGLAAHGTVTPLVAPVAEFMDNGTSIPRMYAFTFQVTGLTPGTSYNFDLLAAVQSTFTLSVFAFGTTSTTPGLASGSDGAPVTMTVQAV